MKSSKSRRPRKLPKYEVENERKEMNEITKITCLNDDCLEEIFKRLPIQDKLEMSLVCQQWKRVEESSWRNIKKLDLTDRIYAHSHLHELPEEYRSLANISKVLKKCGRFLKELSIGVPFRYNILSVVQDHCKNLQKLVLDFKYYGIKFNDTFFSELKNLKSLELYNVRQDLRDNFWSGTSKSLEELKVYGQHYDSIELNFTALSEFTKLSKLTFGYLKLHYEDLPRITALKGLVELTFKQCRINYHWETVDFLLELRNLEKLNFISSVTPDYDGLKKLLMEHTSLKILSLTHCPDISAETWSALSNVSRVRVEYCEEEPVSNDPRSAFLDQMAAWERLTWRTDTGLYDECHDFSSSNSESSESDH